MIARFGRDEHVLYDLHWLPIELHVHLKILLYTYKRFIEYAPPYICDIVQTYKLSKKIEMLQLLYFVLKIFLRCRDIVVRFGICFQEWIENIF